jgi:hypothetical protein
MRKNDNALAEKILGLLKNSEWWTQSTRISGNTIQGLTCPVCGEKAAAWAYLNGPMAINCNRLSQCSSRTKTLELFPELRTNFDQDFKPTKAEPHRPAREYLLSRGVPEALLKGLSFWYLANARNTGSGAVMFPVGKDTQGKQQANGRIFNPPAGDDKTHNIGSTAGLHWRHQGFEYDSTKLVWITEGIIDALYPNDVAWGLLLLSDLLIEAGKRAEGYQDHCHTLYEEISKRIAPYSLVGHDCGETPHRGTAQEVQQ